MQSKSTHGLRLDQLAALLHTAAAGADQADMETFEDKKPKPALQRVPGEVQGPHTNSSETRSDGAA